jgi:hypothetical protein
VQPAVYVLYTVWLDTYTHILVHTHASSLSFFHLVRVQVHTVDPDQQVERQAVSLEGLISEQQEWQQGAARNDTVRHFRTTWTVARGDWPVQRAVIQCGPEDERDWDPNGAGSPARTRAEICLCIGCHECGNRSGGRYCLERGPRKYIVNLNGREF